MPLKSKQAKLTRERILLESALYVRKFNFKASFFVAQSAYLLHGVRYRYFSTYNITTKRFSHTQNMYLKKVIKDMEAAGYIKHVAGTGIEAKIFTLTDKGREEGILVCEAYGLKFHLRKL